MARSNRRKDWEHGVQTDSTGLLRATGRVISIASARREYFSQAEPRKRFDFLCSSEACRAQGIRYRRATTTSCRRTPARPRTSASSRIPPTCRTASGSSRTTRTLCARANPPRRPASGASATSWTPTSKFDPAIVEEAAPPPADPDAEEQPPASAAVRADAPAAPRQRTQRRRARDFRTARRHLSPGPRRTAGGRIQAVGHPHQRPRPDGAARLFPAHRLCHGQRRQVFYGGADLLRARLAEPAARLPLQVPRPHRRQAGIPLRRPGNLAGLSASALPRRHPRLRRNGARYFTLYALGRLVEAPSGKSYSLEPDALRHLAIIPVRRRTTPLRVRRRVGR